MGFPLSLPGGSITQAWALRRASLLLLLVLPLAVPLARAMDVPPEGTLPTCSHEVPFVRNLSATPSSNYGLQGLSHVTVAGKLHHGTKDMEVWLQTIAPGAGTPIHRHDSEEAFMILRGSGLYLRATSGAYTGAKAPGSFPGEPEVVAFGANSSFVSAANEVHQVVNPANSTEDLQVYAVLSRPPVHVYVYPTWTHPHEEAISVFPMFWDRECPSQTSE